jgi:hypothetical protein
MYVVVFYVFAIRTRVSASICILLNFFEILLFIPLKFRNFFFIIDNTCGDYPEIFFGLRLKFLQYKTLYFIHIYARGLLYATSKPCGAIIHGCHMLRFEVTASHASD